MKSLDRHTCATYTNRELLIVQAIRKGMDTVGFLYYRWQWKGCQSNQENRTVNKEKETDNSTSYQCKIMLIPVPKLVEHKNPNSNFLLKPTWERPPSNKRLNGKGVQVWSSTLLFFFFGIFFSFFVFVTLLFSIAGFIWIWPIVWSPLSSDKTPAW